MSTAAQQQANKQNARHSTGPRTEAGKQRSSKNALKHGLCSKDPLIRGEDPDAFDEHYAEMLHFYWPRNVVEEDLVEQIIDITWRLKRCKRIEKAIINKRFDAAADLPSNYDKDYDEMLGEALAPKSHLASIDILGRHETRLRHGYHKALKELRTVRRGQRQTAFFNGLFSGLCGRPEAEPQAESRAERETESRVEPESWAEPEPESWAASQAEPQFESAVQSRAESQAESNGAAERAATMERRMERKNENAERTQSSKPPLESTDPRENADRHPAPRAAGINGLPPLPAENRGPHGHQEAIG